VTENSTDAISAAEALNAKLRDSNHRIHAYLNTLHVLVTALDIAHEDEQVMALLSNSLDALLNAVNASSGAILVLDEDSVQLVYILVNGEQSDASMTWQRVSADTGIAGWVLRHGEAAIVNEASSDERFDMRNDIPEGITAETLLCIPVIAQDKNLGVITLLNKRVDGMFTDDDQTLAWLLGRFAGELLHRMSE
jgi:GAF domain-containing protein